MIRWINLISEIEKTVAVAKEHLTGAVNQTMTEIYWRIGRYIVEFEQSGNEKEILMGKKFSGGIMILIPLLCHDKNSGMKVLEGNCYDKLRQSSAIGLVGYYNFTTIEETKIRSA